MATKKGSHRPPAKGGRKGVIAYVEALMAFEDQPKPKPPKPPSKPPAKSPRKSARKPASKK